MAYDLVGDIHGQGDKLEGLLDHLGYRLRDGAYRHPSRTAIFLGDFIDRGPRQLDCVHCPAHGGCRQRVGHHGQP